MFNLSVLSILGAGVLWGAMGLFVRSLGEYGFNSLQIVSIRLTVAAVCFVVMALVKGINCLKIKAKDIPLLFCTGFSGIMLMSVTYFLAIKHSSLSVAAILLYTAPAFVLVASIYLFKEKLNKVKVLSLALALCGLFLVSGIVNGDANVTVAGVIWGLLSGITYGSYSIFGTYALRKHTSFATSAWAFIFAAISSLFFADIPDAITVFCACEAKIWVLVIMISMGIFSAFLPFLLYTAGLSKLEASKAVVIASVEPLTATVLGFIFYNEIPTVVSLTGIVLILASVILTSLKK